jgi:hypothetical protein
LQTALSRSREWATVAFVPGAHPSSGLFFLRFWKMLL